MKSVEDLKQEILDFFYTGIKLDPEEWLLVDDKEKILSYRYVYDDYVYLHTEMKQYFYVNKIMFLNYSGQFELVNICINIATPVEKTIIDYEF